MSHLTHLESLAALPAAEQRLIDSINAASSTLDGIGTNALDAALARLELAVQGVHSRLGAAMGELGRKVAEISEAMNETALGVLEALSSDAHLDRLGTAHHETTAPTIPAQIAEAPLPITPVFDPTTRQTDGSAAAELPGVAAPIGEPCPACGEANCSSGSCPVLIASTSKSAVGATPPSADAEDLIDLAEPIAGDPVVHHDATGYCMMGRQSAHEARQDAEDLDLGRQPSVAPIAPHTQPRVTEQASLEEIRQVAADLRAGKRPTAPTCKGCGFPAESFSPDGYCADCCHAKRFPTAAANGPIPPHNRDDRKTAKRKPRGKSKAS